MAEAPTLDSWIRRCLRQEQPRSKSLIVTVLGDSIVACGSAAWLSELIGLLAPFGVNERLARTSISRLAEEGWIEAQRAGRRSRYALTASGTARFEHAFQRVYTPPQQHWDGRWTLVALLRTAPRETRAALSSELRWEGYGSLAPGVFLHPAADAAALDEILRRLKLSASALVLQGCEGNAVGDAAALVAQCWDLQDCAQQYRRFLARFEPLAQHLAAGTGLPPAQAFVAQTLLIHAFRRVSLHDPRLPAPMLPPDWPGHAAYRLCRELYRRMQAPSWQHLREQVEPPDGAPGFAVFARRFAEARA